MTELLPCPFCGGEQVEIERCTSLPDDYWRIGCQLCGASFEESTTEAEAIEAWNTRAERTCRAELNGERSAVICSECGSPMPLKGWGEFRDWGGATRIGTFTTYPHCPNCGAKVVE